MNKTQNYQLNQWAKSDRVLMEDFNADNAKLDAALAALNEENTQRKSAISALQVKTGLQVIKEARVSSTDESRSISLSGIDWSAWKIIAAVFDIAGSGGALVYAEDTSGSDTLIGGGTQHFLSVLFPMCRSDMLFAGIGLGSSPELFCAPVSYTKISSICLRPTSSGQSLSGSKVTLLGIA